MFRLEYHEDETPHIIFRHCLTLRPDKPEVYDFSFFLRCFNRLRYNIRNEHPSFHFMIGPSKNQVLRFAVKREALIVKLEFSMDQFQSVDRY